MKLFRWNIWLLLAVFFVNVSCEKDKDLTVQEHLDKGADLSQILQDYPVDSLLGRTYRGGYIFHVYSATNECLVVSSNEISASAEWGCPGLNIPGADSLEIGAGQSNSSSILSNCSSSTNAASVCDFSPAEGFSDWYLPSAAELFEIYDKVYLNGYGNFNSTDAFWSSSQFSDFDAVFLSFTDGNLNNRPKSDQLKVRGVRRTL